MLWHRRPIRPQPHSNDLYLVRQNFLFAHCVHVNGAICLLDETNLCNECYSQILTTIIRQQYRLLNRHFFINGHAARDGFCSACGVVVIITRSIDEYQPCVKRTSRLLRALEDSLTHVDSLKYPLVLNIYNEDPVA